ncbi:hypothetical protein [Komagataeibacter europaeus]|uniref:hypothetical protein n=1 Tax=Komagataeibacter europaeus TaxID=33995 RepID=UPI000B55CE66|nr:hypothetical protein [Komagataeibacter europaeus]ARW15163.1 hypothetical protein S101446_00016 [Komagataeibacter europaeus]
MNIYPSPRGRAIMLLTLAGLVIASSLGACGRIGSPRQPSNSRAYYTTYPSPDR